jgi:hypothetical protein
MKQSPQLKKWTMVGMMTMLFATVKVEKSFG